MPTRATVTALLILTPAAPLAAADPVVGLKVPAGFVVTEFAGPDLANDIYTLHIDARGRVVVAGRGYCRELRDADGDGRADEARDLVSGLTDGPMGVLWEDDTLYLVVDDGLKRYRGVDGLKPVGKAETLLAVKTGGEHDAHAVRRGPDGRLYLLCGNSAGIGKRHAGPGSPAADPVAGALLRLADDGSTQVVADGFRNPYDFAFDAAGEAFTFDSDNERCVGLPWYEGCRFYHVKPGGNYGWRNPQLSQTWRKPPYFADVVPPVADLGRGSPTGVACYLGDRFPPRFQGGFFLADWTFGKVWFVPVEWTDGRYVGRPEPFLEATGENGFAPTGLAVDPKSGDLFVSIGGRGTRGAVYRVRHPGDGGKRVAPERPAPPAPARAETPLEAVRRLQLDLGDLTARDADGTVWEGYTFRKPVPADRAATEAAALRAGFPTGSHDLDRERSRTLAALADPSPEAVGLMTALLTPASDPVDDIHTLIVLGRLPGKRTAADTRRVADALVRLDGKFEAAKLTRDRNWPLRLTEAGTALLRNDPALAAAVVGHPGFGRPDQAWLARLPGLDRTAVARRFVAASAAPGFAWTPGLVELLDVLPDAEARPVLAKLTDPGLDAAVLPLVARAPTPADRPRLVAGLRAASPSTVAVAARALAKMPGPSPVDEGAELVAAVGAFRRVGDGRSEVTARVAVTALLHARTGQDLPPTAAAWEGWLAKEKPALAKQLTSPGFDADAWGKRLAGVNWDSGDPARGKAVFRTATCAACHDGAAAVGPSLRGVTKRFGRADLLTAVLDPSRDVPARYRTTRLTTDDGKVFDGVVVYEATDGVILATGPDSTVRVAGPRIDSRRELPTSLMPAGLLDRLTDAEVADLFAYLKDVGDR